MNKQEAVNRCFEEALIEIDRSINRTLEWQSLDLGDKPYIEVREEIKIEVKRKIAKELEGKQ
jgi:hypothetical protein